MPDWITSLMQALAMPELGLSTVFLVSFLSATLLPLGSEAVVFGLLKINPSLFWPVMAVATVGNTLGGAVSWGMGLAAHRAVDKVRHKPSGHPRARCFGWNASAPRPAC
jgi:membrane protein YqaA with SNARE-associated domain